MRIDAHQHYWKIDRGDYGWLTPDIPVLHKDFLPDDLKPRLDAHRLDGSVVVQAAPTPEETDYLLALAARDESIKGVVGYLDLADDRHAEHYERFVRHPKFVGFRLMIQDMPDAGVILAPSYIEALRSYAQRGAAVDLLVKSDQLEPLIELVEQVPGLRGVIDHIAKPRIAEGLMTPWDRQIAQLASHPNLYCKLSGMVTEADHADWKAEQFIPYVRHALDCFGPDRVMFGSDWPVCLLAAGYDEVVDVLERALPDTWGTAEREKLYGRNAQAFYRL
ncbi:amidohydrolase family protein [Cohnella rhizosphaerae]|uniref:Amidohydrolase family protein n=1 Tax=Cohnella rhizosphaerae TaxID=1457232 RepID=A0A9X4KYM3_9BACL|nr:amidohydrolase family protein [Cohnella rhizosphaerae]MDG0813317.1 amidohydrolase family protein [Cohnella rhizosphaerae]